jgi:ATP-dependent Clp protease protease subunit
MAKSPLEKEPTSFLQLDDRIELDLLEKRRIFICSDISNESAYEAIRKLWYLDLKSPSTPILMIINSPGGAVDAGFAIWDQARMISSPVITLVTGLAASMGSVLSLCAPKGKRLATPNSRFMIHQPLLSGVLQGQATDLDIQAKEMIKTRNVLVQIYVDATGKSPEEIEKAVDRDTWMTANEAKDFGLVDSIVTKNDELEKHFSF